MIKIGVVGANGFIGNRIVEILDRDRTIEICPIFRTVEAMSHSPYCSLDCRIANALDRGALETAFQGCEVIIHSILGSSGLIRASVTTAYHAAQKAGVRRLIYLSSMCVHSQCPPPGTTEKSPLSKEQPFPYNAAKVEAERRLMKLRARGSVEVVIFRPGIVFGPRSRWVRELAEQLLQGTAYLVDEGKGICNTVYVDNLVEAIRLAIYVKEADKQAFFVGDKETVTWLEFYRPFAEALGIEPLKVSNVDVPEFSIPSWKQKLKTNIWNLELTQKLLSLISDKLKQTIKKRILKKSLFLNFNPQTQSSKPQTVVTKEMALLQQSQYKLPWKKAEKILGYKPTVSFQNGCRHSIDWLILNNYLK
ncbi:NAD(P)-dependent oxidoreductase [Myxosarcina sp. GI1]|uniref:NAD-dependent epimerase/dehydratase family protein n=1 Tax=Myxosarcina sp. GI1 TaxID=1541065 RepID=UPI001C122EB8|nr:NAD(P)-dependent oxidoreductase [Myxosarcina sp. GI1]